MRVVAGIIFIMAGWMKITGIDMFVGMLDGGGFPLPAVLAWIVAIVELLGGIAILVGFLTRESAALLGITMIVAFFVVLAGQGLQAAWYPLALAAGMVGLLFSGAGKLSIEGAKQ